MLVPLDATWPSFCPQVTKSPTLTTMLPASAGGQRGGGGGGAIHSVRGALTKLLVRVGCRSAVRMQDAHVVAQRVVSALLELLVVSAAVVFREVVLHLHHAPVGGSDDVCAPWRAVVDACEGERDSGRSESRAARAIATPWRSPRWVG